MTSYLSLIFCMFFTAVCSVDKHIKKNQILYLALILVLILSLFAGTRLIGWDYGVYMHHFDGVPSIENYSRTDLSMEIGYEFFLSICKTCFGSFHAFLVIFSALSISLAMLLCYDDYLSLKEQIECALLLDIGHLKVSSKTLGKDFTTESKQCFAIAQYIHISDNNGLRDENKPIATTSEFLPMLAATHNRNRIYTLEVYSGLEDVRASYEILQGCIAIS